MQKFGYQNNNKITKVPERVIGFRSLSSFAGGVYYAAEPLAWFQVHMGSII